MPPSADGVGLIKFNNLAIDFLLSDKEIEKCTFGPFQTILLQTTIDYGRTRTQNVLVDGLPLTLERHHHGQLVQILTMPKLTFDQNFRRSCLPQ